MIELFISSFITFFVVIDPPGCAPIYASLTSDAPPRDRRIMAIRAIVVAAVILLVFALFGEQMLGALGISLDSFRIAGGIMLFLIALEMVFEKRTERREDRAQEIIEQPEIEDVSIFPMAMPMIAGPGSIAAVMLLTSQNDSIDNAMIILGALGSVLLLTLIGLLAAGPLMRILGNKVEAVITRVLGVLLGALAVQFVVDGLNASF
ncbi:MAG: MarC family protein [Sphingomonadales bacterium]|nr:MarC family protein [Sphingomonadales bacterium]PIX66494.1 MAG: MarC family transcriptional regulator [Sphingomonadales bacterium CG_4_10_14_3_um_filter_58_15]NCO50236.1 MarC family protein [Sphingomonadales bacterium]NCP00498.1 MarC family protein [Sphingomonadales bacterium]NCP26115.1 MarC family protein [Sphingomonadales bacterium]